MKDEKRNPRKVFLTLWLAAVLGVVAIVPYSLTLNAAQLAKNPPALPLRLLIPLQIAQNAVLFAALVAAGLFFAYRCGLGAPILEAFFRSEKVRARIMAILLPSIVLGVAASLVIIGLDKWVFAPALKTQVAAGAATNAATLGTPPPAWQGFLASFYGGIAEEVMLRLFLFSMLAWLGKFISHTSTGRPTTAVLWVVNVLVAIVFGLGHLPATSLALAITPLVVTRAIVLNGLAGLVFGFLYWTRGIESAMLSHFSADLILHVLFAL
jgi:membrane protease YdiL (CAAX protease family)